MGLSPYLGHNSRPLRVFSQLKLSGESSRATTNVTRSRAGSRSFIVVGPRTTGKCDTNDSEDTQSESEGLGVLRSQKDRAETYSIRLLLSSDRIRNPKSRVLKTRNGMESHLDECISTATDL